MVSDADMLEEVDAGLAHAAHLLLAAAEKNHQLLQASEDAREVADLSKALDGNVRSLRLTYALRMKLRRDAKRDAREDVQAKAQRDKEQVRVRKHRLEAAVRGLLPTEGDYEDYDEGSDFDWDLLEAINDEALSETFLGEDLGDLAARVLRKLGFEITPDGRVVHAISGKAEPAVQSSA
jgi:hypothetical protein